MPENTESNSLADDLATRIVVAWIEDDGPSTDLLWDVLAQPNVAMQVLGNLGFLAADMAIDAAHGDEDTAKRNITEAFQ